MRAELYVRIVGGLNETIRLNLAEARELRDFLLSEPSITPDTVMRPVVEKKKAECSSRR